jgi:hypothetical protein
MAHPHLVALAGRPNPVKKSAISFDLRKGAAKFSVARAFYFSTELSNHGHLAITDA